MLYTFCATTASQIEVTLKVYWDFVTRNFSSTGIEYNIILYLLLYGRLAIIDPSGPFTSSEPSTYAYQIW